MSNATAKVHTSDMEDRVPDRSVPRGIRLLAYLSTNRWRPQFPVHPRLVACADDMERDGWMIRGAWRRNYVLWRHGRTMREAALPFLVLPLTHGRLSPLHMNVFLAVEMIRAKARVEGARSAPAEPETDLAAMVNAITADTGVTVGDPDRLHRNALHELETFGIG